MNPRQWTFCVLCGTTLLAVIGCYSHYPHSIYGPGGYPGTYSNPPLGSGAPGGTVVPQGSSFQGPGAALSPGAQTFNSQPLAGGGPSQGRQPGRSGGDAPIYDSNRDGLQADGVNKPVPNYPNSNDVRDFEDTKKFDGFDGTDAFGTDDGRGAGDSKAPFGSGSSNQSPFDGAALNDADDAEPFISPIIPVKPVSTAKILVKDATRRNRPNPYKYDRKHYRWLRGVVDYDDEDGTWNIIYNLQPDENDEFGGSMTLLGLGQKPELESHDVVLVEGRVDSDHRDALGKPQFRVNRLQRLAPSR